MFFSGKSCTPWIFLVIPRSLKRINQLMFCTTVIKSSFRVKNLLSGNILSFSCTHLDSSIAEEKYKWEELKGKTLPDKKFFVLQWKKLHSMNFPGYFQDSEKDLPIPLVYQLSNCMYCFTRQKKMKMNPCGKVKGS